MESYFPNAPGNFTELARQRVLDDLRVLAADAEMLLNATVGDLGDKALEARDRLKAGLARAKVTIVDLQQKGYASAQAAAKSTDLAIRDHPYQSVGIAMGVGLLVGLILGRE